VWRRPAPADYSQGTAPHPKKQTGLQLATKPEKIILT
jgi:hypothetical protein